MNVATPNDPFALLWALGYRNLCPITPPGAPLADNSSLALRMRNGGEDARGKAPGVKRHDGRWIGLDFVSHQSDEADLQRWRSWGAGVGIVCRDDIRAIDADTLDAQLAKIIKDAVEAAIGPTPIRIGRHPKALYVVRVSGPSPYQMFEFGPAGKKRERVEILAGGKQFVAYGTHPGTMEPYRWVAPLLAYADLPVVSPADLTTLMTTLRGLMPEAGPLKAQGAPTEIDQASLRGDPAIVRAAVRVTRNTCERFPTRESYRDFGYAIKGALGDTAEALDAYQEWAADYRGPAGETNDPDVVAADWRRMRPPFRIGAPYLYALARETSGGAFDGRSAQIVKTFHEPIDVVGAAIDGGESIFPKPEKPLDEPELELVVASTLANLPIPEQKWLVKDLIPANNVTILSGDGGVGKSLVALQIAIACASKSDWLGLPVTPGAALYLSAEDEIEELHKRTKTLYPDMWSLHGLTFGPLAGKDAILAAPEGREGLLKPTKLFGAVTRAVERTRASLLVLDTLADIFGGDEIRKIHARSFISMLRGLALTRNVTIVLLLHPSLTGMLTNTGASGNVGWKNSVRSFLYLNRIIDKDGLEFDVDRRVLEIKKSNRSKVGLALPIRWSAGRFVRDGSATTGDPGDADVNAESLFLALLDRCEHEERHVTYKAHCSNYAPKVFAAHHLAAGLGKQHFARAMDKLFEQSVIQRGTYRRDRKTYERIVRAEYNLELNNDLFG